MRLGNPDLKPTLAWNADLMVEHYLKSVGILSAGVFYKRPARLHLHVHVDRSDQRRDVHGDAAAERRVGFGAPGSSSPRRAQLAFLPAPFDGLGVYANYTFTDSSAVFPGRDGERATLPGQSRHVGNLAVSYEKGASPAASP